MINLIVGVAFAVGIIGWIYQVLFKPPPPKICGSLNGPPITSLRVRLHDGRHLAYKEVGVPKKEAKHKIIICHGLNSCKDQDFPVSQDLIDDLKLYFLIYDRAGHCESDPYPSRSVKTEAFDIQELADKLELGTHFYVIGCSMGAYPIWACLKYIPHRLLGASFVTPLVNFWWPSFPSVLLQRSLKKFPRSIIRTFWIAHHTPWLIYWWMTQKWFKNWEVRETMIPDSDLGTLKRIMERPEQKKIPQQGHYECFHRDFKCFFGEWEFDPMALTNPFPDNKGSVHLWHGNEDRFVPLELNRFVAQTLPWIRYHELPNSGHLIMHEAENLEAIIKTLIAG